MTSEQDSGASLHTPSGSAVHGVESLVVGAAAQLDSKLNMVAQQINDPRSVAGQNEALTPMAQPNAAVLEHAARQHQSEALRSEQTLHIKLMQPHFNSPMPNSHDCYGVRAR